MLFFLTVLVVLFTVVCSEVIVLDSSNFEHLTQATTGATTGDWLIKFYAPWCGHCRQLEPVYEKVAELLNGEVNVAKVDVPQSRDLGTRFDIKGFPTLKLLSKGQVYTYKGRRTAEDIAEFARGGFALHQPEEVAPPLGMFGEIAHVYRHAYKQASKDLVAGNFFTVDVFLTFLPLLFVIVLLLLILAPTPAPPRRVKREQPQEEDDDEDDDVVVDTPAPSGEKEE
jgi:thioredoxin domain-containing protein 5